MAQNIVRKENQRTYETVTLGTVKYGVNGKPEAPGAATASIKGFVTAGLQQAWGQTGVGSEFPKPQVYGYLVTGVSSFTNVIVGAKIDDNGAFKIFPTATPGEILAIDEKAKTLVIGVPSAVGTSGALSGLLATAQRKILEEKTKEEAEGVSKAAEDTFTCTNFTEVAVNSGALVNGALPAVNAFQLVSPAIQFADLVSFNINILEASGASSVIDETLLHTSFDGGFTWAEVGKVATAVTGALSATGTLNIKEKLVGPRLAITLKAKTELSKNAGYIIVAANRISEVSVPAV